MINNFRKASDETGRSMIEMLGVLAIVGVLSVGGIALKLWKNSKLVKLKMRLCL